MGIVGLPNVGKSTTFNLLTKLNVQAENYPFCTIEPNLAQVAVPDVRVDGLIKLFKPKSKIYASLKISDIAGLVPGASKGEGLGNAFLSHIRECDGIFQVLRAFEDDEVVHTEMDVNPIRDMDIITEELCLKDLEQVDKQMLALQGKIDKMNNKDAKEEKVILEKVKVSLEERKWLTTQQWSQKEIEYLNTQFFLTAKQIVYLINLSPKDYKSKKNKWLAKIKEKVESTVIGPMIPYSAAYEQELLQEELSKKEEEKKEDEPVKNLSCMPRIIKTGYKALDLSYFYTAGEDEVRAWTIRSQTKAPQAAGVIHTDFEKGFIMAEVMKYDDLIRCGTQGKCKDEGKYYQKGKDYTCEDGDIIFFRFNVGTKAKK